MMQIKAVLDYYKIPYKTIEVNPLTKSELRYCACTVRLVHYTRTINLRQAIFRRQNKLSG